MLINSSFRPLPFAAVLKSHSRLLRLTDNRANSSHYHCCCRYCISTTAVGLYAGSTIIPGISQALSLQTSSSSVIFCFTHATCCGPGTHTWYSVLLARCVVFKPLLWLRGNRHVRSFCCGTHTFVHCRGGGKNGNLANTTPCVRCLRW